ncbi:FliM/FliN family flagellar motor switch protein [Marinobacterium sp. D7]|uniref:FliM/FliN family flagellar motor C-terminal domain-containing protein n=1 Tax=Marinobacterium ramblicola TaxID=2849041 RepID=UPI001C2D89B6|nr:FliM/FliN family flagellar motor switch protein [Marinobacterium ramblicola]MBV1787717.1 FliM/FliN family flagellar motor switch protein [Marinobacterium ramblicola]
MLVRPFIILGADHIQKLENSLENIFSDWVSEWFTGPGDISIQVETLGADGVTIESDDELSSFFKNSVDEWVAFRCDNDSTLSLAASLLGLNRNDIQKIPKMGGIVNSVILAAFNDFGDKALKCELFPCTSGIEYFLHKSNEPGKGVIRCSINLGDVKLVVLMPAFKMAELYLSKHEMIGSNPTSMKSPLDAMGGQKIKGELSLGVFELSLGSLANLECGDVIKLDKNLGDPLSLRFNNTGANFFGHLGQYKSRFAFKVENISDN